MAILGAYVAGKTHDFEIVRQAQRNVHAAGWKVTYDWTTAVEHHGAEHELEQPTRAQAAHFAAKDCGGVKAADLLIAVPHPDWCGTLLEIGMALNSGAPILLLGQPYQRSVFWARPSIYVMEDWANHHDLLRQVLYEIARRRVRSLLVSGHIEDMYLEGVWDLELAAVEGRSA